jgi:choline-sulfatase
MSDTRRRHDRPHILMLVSDEHSPHYLPWEGHPHVRTPNLERLRSEGVNLRNGYCNSPICAPSRASQIAGRYCRTCGVTDWFMDLQPGTVTLPGHFAAHGYETVAFGKMHFYGDQMKGWQERPLGDLYDPVTNRPVETERNLKHMIGEWERPWSTPWWDAAERISLSGAGHNPSMAQTEGMYDAGLYRLRERLRNGPPEKPLFLCISTLTPHYPFVCPEPIFSHYRSRVELPDVSEDEVAGLHPAYQAKIDRQHPYANSRDEQLNAIAAYCGMIEHMDRQIGRALETLEELGVRDEFIVVHWSDHGDMMGEHGQWWKRSFYEASARVPFLFSSPGLIASGHEVAENTSLVDIFPTLCELCGLPVPDGLDGTSMTRLLRGEENPDWPDIAFSENWQPSLGEEYVPAVMLKKGPYKLSRFGSHPQPLLHDLANDPDEMHDVADDPAYQTVRAELEGELAKIVGRSSTSASTGDSASR